MYNKGLEQCKNEPMYYCAICGAMYKTVEERAACEAKCLEKKKAEDAKIKAEAKDKAKKEAEERIDNEIKLLLEQYHKIVEMTKEYYDKYDRDIYNYKFSPYTCKSILDFIF